MYVKFLTLLHSNTGLVTIYDENRYKNWLMVFLKYSCTFFKNDIE
jgi:hypothetical protein